MYAVMRFAKLKTMGEIGALGKHNERERETRNADEARRGDNVRLAGSGDWCADVGLVVVTEHFSSLSLWYPGHEGPVFVLSPSLSHLMREE